MTEGLMTVIFHREAGWPAGPMVAPYLPTAPVVLHLARAARAPVLYDRGCCGALQLYEGS